MSVLKAVMVWKNVPGLGTSEVGQGSRGPPHTGDGSLVAAWSIWFSFSSHFPQILRGAKKRLPYVFQPTQGLRGWPLAARDGH